MNMPSISYLDEQLGENFSQNLSPIPAVAPFIEVPIALFEGSQGKLQYPQ